MEPRIQYTQTQDGVNIAFWTHGEGAAIVQPPPVPFSQVQLAAQMPEDRRWSDLITRGRKLVRYDARGTGLSQRNVSEFSLEHGLLDLEAVAQRLDVEQFVLWAFVTGGPVAIAYAARHPERVSHLILWSAWARNSDVLDLPQARGLLALMDTDWDLFSETAAHAFFGWSEGELAHRAAAFMRDGVTRETTKAMVDAMMEIDVSDLLPEVEAPTLVFHSREAPLPDVSAAQELASRIPNARLSILEGTVAGWKLSPEVAKTIGEFLGDSQEGVFETFDTGALVTILFTDMEDSTSLTQRLGDARAQELVRAHDTIVREALAAHGGSEIKHTGDGIMASVPSASGAVECARAIQRAVAARNDPNLQVRIGLNAGEPLAEEADLFGTAVQLARRICDHAAAGEILVSDVVRQLAAGKGFSYSDRGEAALRGFDEPVRLYDARWRE